MIRCPVPLCSCTQTTRSNLLAHMRRAHDTGALSEQMLSEAQAILCPTCGVLKSAVRSSRHKCRPSNQPPPQPTVLSPAPVPHQAPSGPPLQQPPPLPGPSRWAGLPAPWNGLPPVHVPPASASPPPSVPQPNSPPPLQPEPEQPGLVAEAVDQHAQAHAEPDPVLAVAQDQPAPAPPAAPLPQPDRPRPARTVPSAAREDWTRAFTRTAEDVVTAITRGGEQGITDAFAVLLELPSRALADTGASRGRARRVRTRLQLIDAGEEPTGPAAAARRPRRPAPAKHKLAARVHRNLQLGSISRAAKCLEALPLQDPTDEAIEVLRALHPSAPPPPALEPTAAPVGVVDDVLLKVLKALPKGSAPGRSGWTYEHIRAAAEHDVSARAVTLQLINALVSGRLPHLPVLLDGRLIGLEKPNGGTRPIAIGEVWLRLASLCAMASIPGVGAALAPLQLGVGVRGGSQCIGHAIRAGIEADPDCVTVQLDWTNAFNTVPRDVLLAAIAKRQPSLLPFASWSYGQASRLYVEGAPPDTPPVMSECGVRQGDPLGPLYFALALQDPLERMALVHPASAPLAYADDTFLQSSPAVVIPAFRTLCELGTTIGLIAKLPKCGVYSRNTANAAEVAAALGIAHRLDGLLVAGTPVGTDAFITAHADSRAESVCAAIDTLMDLPLPAQDQFLILRSALQPRLDHLARTSQWAFISAALALAENKTAEAVSKLVKRPLQDCIATGQLTLPLRLGGVGLRVMSELEAGAAFLSAAAMTEAAMRTGPTQYRPFAGPATAGLAQAWHALHADATELWPEETVEFTAECITDTLPGVQKLYSRFVAVRRHAALLASFPRTLAGQRDSARLRSCGCRAASIWLETLPTAESLTLKNGDWIASMRLRLGLGHMPANAPGVKCSCGWRIEASDTDHHMTCKKSTSGPMTLRHDILLAIVRRIAARAGVATSAEPKLHRLHRASTGSAALRARPESRGDILFVLPEAVTVGDISVVHPAASTYVLGASRTDGSAAAARDRLKRDRYQTADPTGYAFTPISVESFGRLGKPAMELLSTLASIAAAGGSVDRDMFMTNALRELSIGLCRGTGFMCRCGVSHLAKVTGDAFMPGLTVPTAEIY